MNQAVIIGNLTRDPELKALPSGVKVCNFSVATNESYTDSNGQKQESVEYHNVIVFGRQAETTAQYMRKGSQVLIIGKIQTRSWEDKDTGKKLYRTEINARRVQFGRNPNNDGGKPAASSYDEAVAHDAKIDAELTSTSINPDDIPF
jgi:single-strand DNA-binding protein